MCACRLLYTTIDSASSRVQTPDRLQRAAAVSAASLSPPQRARRSLRSRLTGSLPRRELADAPSTEACTVPAAALNTAAALLLASSWRIYRVAPSPGGAMQRHNHAARLLCWTSGSGALGSCWCNSCGVLVAFGPTDWPAAIAVAATSGAHQQPFRHRPRQPPCHLPAPAA